MRWDRWCPGTQSKHKTLRSCSDSREWLPKHIAFGIATHIKDFLRQLQSPRALGECLFVACPMTCKLNDALTLMGEDEFAELLGQASIGMVALRSRRLLYVFEGWPRKWAGALTTDDTTTALINEWKHDYDIYHAYNA